MNVMKTFVVLAAIICIAIINASADGKTGCSTTTTTAAYDPCSGMLDPVQCFDPDICCCNKCPQCTCTCQGKSVVIDPTCLWTEHGKPHDCVCDCPDIRGQNCTDVCKIKGCTLSV